MTQGPHISQDDLALFAMQALTPEESAVVRAHLRECALCREELSRLTGDLSLVAMSVEQHDLPAGAQQRFMDRIASDAATREQSKPADLGASKVTSIDQSRRSAKSLLWGSWMVAAALIAIAVSLQMQVRSLRRQMEQQAAVLDQQRSESACAEAVLELLNAPAAQHVVLRAAKSQPEPSAKAVYMASTGALLLQASNLNPVQQDKTYELWLIPASGSPIPAGTFRPDAAGNASVVLPPLPRGVQAKAFGVTVEASGGSASPTLPIVLVGAAPVPGE